MRRSDLILKENFRFNPNAKLDASQIQVRFNGRWMTLEEKKKFIRKLVVKAPRAGNIRR